MLSPVRVMMPRKQRVHCLQRLRPGRRCDRRDGRLRMLAISTVEKEGGGLIRFHDERSRPREWLRKASSAHELCIRTDGHQIRTFMIRLRATPASISQGRRKVGIRRPLCSPIRFAGLSSMERASHGQLERTAGRVRARARADAVAGGRGRVRRVPQGALWCARRLEGGGRRGGGCARG